MASREKLVDWLNDAYAMEQSQIEMLERFIKDFDSESDIANSLQDHLDSTLQQRELVVGCLQSLGKSPSKVKAVMGNISGTLQGLNTGMYKDEKIKNMLAIHAGEHFEHASYIALAEAARQCEEIEIAATCESIAAEEEETAKWALDQLPALVQNYLKTEEH